MQLLLTLLVTPLFGSVRRQDFRHANGGLVDRSRPLWFLFNGKKYWGYRGDTLASALLANGVRLVARSFKLHRPRGVFGCGLEEPNALVTLGFGPDVEPNLQATQIKLFEGLVAKSQNCWPSVSFDIGALAGWARSLLHAGFYYKTFMWPAKAWPFFEYFLRHAAGMGRAPRSTDPESYVHQHAFCDILIVGGGAAGLAATLGASRSGARLILVDEQTVLGGSLLGRQVRINGQPATDWIKQTAAAIEDQSAVTILRNTTVFGLYDDNMACAVEQVSIQSRANDGALPRQRIWWIRARTIILATGVIERPLVFGDNDRPGVMLAGAARTYLNRYAVKAGKRAVVFTNNDTAYWASIDLARAGIDVAAIVDVRPQPGSAALAALRRLGVNCLAQHAVIRCIGRREVKGVEIGKLNGTELDKSGTTQNISCDLVCVSGGFNPALALFTHTGNRLHYDEAAAAFIPASNGDNLHVVGAANGMHSLADCLAGSHRIGFVAAQAYGGAAIGGQYHFDCEDEVNEASILPVWAIPIPKGRRWPRFVDLQNDVTIDDIALALREGYDSIEQVKRYTTLGMAMDQGRTSSTNAAGIVASSLSTSIKKTGTTTLRPPYVPVRFGAIAGHRKGQFYAPVRVTPAHDWHTTAGASFVDAGLWKRPSAYLRAGEKLVDASSREALSVRRGVGIVDVSTLGKLEIHGRDAAEFLDHIYANKLSTLRVGRCRYGLMLREDGFVFDDGTITRLSEHAFFLTTTTANVRAVLAHFDFCRQVIWPNLDVFIVPVTENWAAFAIAGPHSRQLLAQIVTGLSFDESSFPHMSFGQGRIGTVLVRVSRISFSGELAYEVYAPAEAGLAVWKAVITEGKPFDLVPYGTEAMAVLRIEKGHIAGNEINGRTTASDLGLGRLLSPDKDFIGRRLLTREALCDPMRMQLVGLVPCDGKAMIPRGAQLVTENLGTTPVPVVGEVTSTCYSPNCGHPIALALVRDGRRRHGQTLFAASPLEDCVVPVTISSPVFVDPDGSRLHDRARA